MIVATILRGVTIFMDLQVKGSAIIILIMIVAVTHMGEVSKSAALPPIAAAASA